MKLLLGMSTMTMKKIVFISAVATLCCSIANANTFEKAYQGQFLSVNAGASYANKLSYAGESDSGVMGFGTNLFFGDQIGAYFAPEVQLNYFDLPPMGNAIVFGLDGKFTLPIQERNSLFARLGVAMGYLRTCVGINCATSNGIVPTLGLGTGYDLGHRWVATLECNGAFYPQSTANGNGIIGALTIGATRYFY